MSSQEPEQEPPADKENTLQPPITLEQLNTLLPPPYESAPDPGLLPRTLQRLSTISRSLTRTISTLPATVITGIQAVEAELGITTGPPEGSAEWFIANAIRRYNAEMNRDESDSDDTVKGDTTSTPAVQLLTGQLSDNLQALQPYREGDAVRELYGFLEEAMRAKIPGLTGKKLKKAVARTLYNTTDYTRENRRIWLVPKDYTPSDSSRAGFGDVPFVEWFDKNVLRFIKKDRDWLHWWGAWSYSLSIPAINEAMMGYKNDIVRPYLQSLTDIDQELNLDKLSIDAEPYVTVTLNDINPDGVVIGRFAGLEKYRAPLQPGEYNEINFIGCRENDEIGGKYFRELGRCREDMWDKLECDLQAALKYGRKIVGELEAQKDDIEAAARKWKGHLRRVKKTTYYQEVTEMIRRGHENKEQRTRRTGLSRRPGAEYNIYERIEYLPFFATLPWMINRIRLLGPNPKLHWIPEETNNSRGDKQ